MIYAQTDTTQTAFLDSAPTGLVGTLTFQVISASGAVVIAETVAGITELLGGIYSKPFTAPGSGGDYLIVWTNGAHRTTEELVVTTTPPPVLQPVPPTPALSGIGLAPAYTVNADYEAYAEGWTTTDPLLLMRQLARAERYIDLLGASRPLVIPATDSLHIIVISGDPTGGYFSLTVDLAGTSYTSDNIMWNSSASAAAAAINRAAGFPGTVSAVGGPLPYAPVYLSYRGAAGAQYVAQGVVASTNLTGDNTATVGFYLSGRGGAVDKRFNLSSLQASDIQALKSAVCAQAQYMQEMDPALFSSAQYGSVKGPDFTTTGRLPVVAPLARRELALAGLVVGTARSRP